MGTKVPLVTAAHVHNKRASMADPHKPNLGPNYNDAPDSHHSYTHQTATASLNGLSNGLYPSQSATYGSTLSTGTLDKFGVTRIHSSPERQRRNSTSLLNCVPEDGTMNYDHEEEEESRFVGGASLDGDEEEELEELELDEELAAEGLYRGEVFIDRHALERSLI